MKNNQALTMYPLFFDPIYKKAEMKKIDGKDCICYQEDFWGTKVEEDGTKVVGWEREERELTLDEYQQMKLVQEVVNTNKSEIVSSVTDFQKSAVIDEYTLQLVEEGLL